MVRVGLLLLLTYTTIPRNGSLWILSPERSPRDANNAVLGALPGTERSRNFYGYRIGWLCRLWFTRPRYGAGNSHFVRFVAGWSGTSSGIRRERNRVQRPVRGFHSIILIKSLIKSFSRRAIALPGRRTDFNLINATSASKRRDKSVRASAKSFDNSVPYGEISRTSAEKYLGGK